MVQNMRAADREEIFATHFFKGDGTEDQEYATAILANAKTGVLWVAYSGSEPVALMGLDLMWPSVAAIWMFATDRWLSVGLGLTRFARQTIVPLLKDAGIHRAQCWSQDGHETAQKWLEMLGATFETIAPGYGRNGESFCLFAWVQGRDF